MFKTPRERGGELVAVLDGLLPGDYRVRVEARAGTLTMPDAPPVWDALTVIDPAIEADGPAPE